MIFRVWFCPIQNFRIQTDTNLVPIGRIQSPWLVDKVAYDPESTFRRLNLQFSNFPEFFLFFNFTTSDRGRNSTRKEERDVKIIYLKDFRYQYAIS
jgi:hypothetical protein